MFGYSQTTTFEEVVLSYVDEAKTAFDALAVTDKRAYTNSNVNVTFDPAQALTPLTDANQTYDVTVTFEKDGYTRISTYEETVLAINYQITSNTDWLENGNSFTSQNHNNSTTGTLTMTILKDTTIDYNVSSESGYDYLEILVNGTSQVKVSGVQTGTLNVNQNDTVEITYESVKNSVSVTKSNT